MEEYKNIVMEALPMMLNPETKGRASVTIAQYMNAMLRKVQKENDLLIFAQVLQQCKDFSQQNNLGGLNRTCSQWNHEGIIKLQSLRGKNDSQIQQNYNVTAQQLVQKLQEIANLINKTGIVDTTELEYASQQLSQIEIFINAQGSHIFNQQQLQQLHVYILQQRSSIQTKLNMIDDIVETNHMTR